MSTRNVGDGRQRGLDTGHHPLADLFPLLGDDDLQSLADDIAANGLRQPILVYDGKVLDGRNRLRACEFANVEPRFEVFEGTEDAALALVLSLNLARRHLTAAQRAVLGVKLLPHEKGLATARMLAGRARDDDPGHSCAQGSHGKATAAAGAKLGISGESVRRAKKIAEESPRVFRAMEDGLIPTVFGAVKIAALPPRRQAKLITRMRNHGISVTEALSSTWRRGSDDEEWYTPPEVLDAVRAALGGSITLDPASSDAAQQNVHAARYFTADDYGLSQVWRSSRLFLNPPYGIDGAVAKQATWVEKLISEYEAGRTKRAVLLIRPTPETHYFAQLWAFPVCFVRGRIKFIPGPDTKPSKPTIPSVLVGLGIEHEVFTQAFSDMGHIVIPSGRSGVSEGFSAIRR